MDVNKLDLTGIVDQYHVPTCCRLCQGIMVYQGIGEYKCESCGAVDYDDYGKTRNYIEANPGATAVQIEIATGVSQKSIRAMLRQSRLEVANGSLPFLKCELCGTPIRSGRFCNSCEFQNHRAIESELRKKRQQNVKGVGMGQTEVVEGQKRFVRDDRK